MSNQSSESGQTYTMELWSNVVSNGVEAWKKFSEGKKLDGLKHAGLTLTGLVAAPIFTPAAVAADMSREGSNTREFVEIIKDQNISDLKAMRKDPYIFSVGLVMMPFNTVVLGGLGVLMGGLTDVFTTEKWVSTSK